jgi:type II secretory pathway component PulF
MNIYNITVITAENEVKTIKHKANNTTEIYDYCKQNKYIIKKIRQENNFISKIKEQKENVIKQSNAKSSFTTEDITEFIGALLLAEDADMNTKERYEYMSEVLEKPKLKFALDRFNDDVINGMEPSDALNKIGMPNYITRSIRVGGETGDLKPIYKKIIEMLETTLETKKKIGKMLMMPKISMGFLYVMFLFFVMFFFTKIKETLGTMIDYNNIPEISKVFFDLNVTSTENPIMFVSISLFILIAFYKIVYFLISKIIKYMPVLNKIYLYEDMIRFFSLLSVSLSSNIPIVKAIEYSANSIKDKTMQTKLFEIARKIEEGGISFSEVAKKDKVFDKVSIIFIRNAEKTNNGSIYYDKLTKIFTEKLNTTIERASTFITPFTYLIIAGFVLLIYYASMSPMWSIQG